MYDWNNTNSKWKGNKGILYDITDVEMLFDNHWKNIQSFLKFITFNYRHNLEIRFIRKHCLKYSYAVAARTTMWQYMK